MYRRVRGPILLLALCVLPMRMAMAQRIKMAVKLSQLEARVKADSNDPAAHYNVALGYWNEKRWEDAERSIRTAIMLEPRFAPAHLALAYLPYGRQPKLWDAMWGRKLTPEDTKVLRESDQEYRRAFMIDPLVDIRILGAVTRTKIDFLTVQDYLGDVYALFFQGFTDCQEGDYETCHQRFSALIREIQGEKFPDRVPNSVLWYKGLAAAHIQKYDIAAQHLKVLMDRNISFEKELEKKGELSRVPLETNEYRFALATVQQAAGQVPEAVALYQQVLESDAGMYMAHVRLANIYEAAKDYPRAVQERTNAVNINPDDPSLVLDLGITLGKAGMMPEAEAKLQDAIQANPRDSRAYFWLGLAEMEQGKQAPAKAAFTTFLALSPSRYDRQIAMARDRLTRLP
jgi:tetratricopeptide (TPR) repeat protein